MRTMMMIMHLKTLAKNARRIKKQEEESKCSIIKEKETIRD